MQSSITTDKDEVHDCCSLVFDIVETGIHDLQHSGVVDAEGDLHRLDEMVQLTLAISPHVEGGSSLLHSVIDVRQAVIEEVEAMNVVQLGRPQIPIQESQLRFYLDHNFTIQHIAGLLHCSRRTVERRMREYGISSRSRFSTICDSDLEVVVSSFVRNNPNLGERSVDGLLRSQGVVVQRQRLRNTMSCD